MAVITIRKGFAWQADYLDLKDIKSSSLTTNKILSDLRNVCSLTNVEDSKHICCLFNTSKSNTQLFFDLYRSTLGDFFVNKETYRGYVEDLGQKRYQSTKQDNREFSSAISGVLFMHTVMYKHECNLYLWLLSRYFSEIMDIDVNKVCNSDLAISTSAFMRHIRSWYEYMNNRFCVELRHQVKIQDYRDATADPLVLTLILPIAEEFDYTKHGNEICNKRFFYKEGTYLGNMLPVFYSEGTNSSHHLRTAKKESGKDIINTISVNTTYFPSSLCKSYYNTYVEAMATTDASSLLRLSELTNCFDYKDGTKETWYKLQKYFTFQTYDGNIIDVTKYQMLSGVFDNLFNRIPLEDKNYFSINFEGLERQCLFLLSLFPGGSIIHNLLIELIYTGKPSVGIDILKELLFHLDKEIEEINDEQILIPESTVKDIKKFFVFMSFYRIIRCNQKRNVEEINFSYGDSKIPSITSNRIHITETALKSRPKIRELIKLISVLIDNSSNEEIISMVSGIKEDYTKSLIENFKCFLYSNTKFKEIMKGFSENKLTPYIETNFISTCRQKDFTEKDKTTALKYILSYYVLSYPFLKNGSYSLPLSFKTKTYLFQDFKRYMNNRYLTPTNRNLPMDRKIVRNLLVSFSCQALRDEANAPESLYPTIATMDYPVGLSVSDYIKKITTFMETNL